MKLIIFLYLITASSFIYSAQANIRNYYLREIERYSKVPGMKQHVAILEDLLSEHTYDSNEIIAADSSNDQNFIPHDTKIKKVRFELDAGQNTTSDSEKKEGHESLTKTAHLTIATQTKKRKKIKKNAIATCLKKYPCTECSKLFVYKSVLETHKKTMHIDQEIVLPQKKLVSYKRKR